MSDSASKYANRNRQLGLSKSEEYLALITGCILSFGLDAFKNIQSLVVLCGEILGGTCSLYNRLESGFLCSRGMWHVPSGYNPLDKPEGHICYDVIKRGSDLPLIVRNLSQTPYVQTDPNVSKYKLETYLGIAVKCAGDYIGSLCVVYQKDFVPSEENKLFLGIIASVIGLEEGSMYTESKLKAAYEQLEQKQFQLIQSSKMATIGQLASSVAHEINNPLTGVLNNVQLIRMIQEQKKDFNVLEFNELLEAVEESALRCKKITQALLDFSHSAKVSFKPVSIDELVGKVTAIIEYEMKLENIIIKRELEPGLPMVYGEPQLLQQVILDIISNAKWAIEKKTGKNGGTITIKTGFNPQSGQVTLSIADTGIGISNDNIKNIFTPFFTTKPAGEGTGLGLSIVHGIIKKHKGNIEVESQQDKGAIFRITLPVFDITGKE